MNNSFYELEGSIETVQQIILGCFIRSTSYYLYSKQIQLLKKSYFTNDICKAIFKVLLKYRKENHQYIEPKVLSIDTYKELESNKITRDKYKLERVTEYVNDTYYLGQPIKFYFLVSKFIEISIEKEMREILKNPTIKDKAEKMEELIDYNKKCMSILQRNKEGDTPQNFSEMVKEKVRGLSIRDRVIKAIENKGAIEDPDLIDTGSTGLNKIIKGFKRTNLITIGGRPSMGKTSFGITLANNMATKTNENILFINLEMTKEEFLYRRLAIMSGESTEDILEGKMTKESFKKFDYVLHQLEKEDNFKQVDTSCMDINHIIGLIRLCVEEAPTEESKTSVVIIDYLQMINDSSLGRNSLKTYEIESVCSKLKSLAKELDIAIIVLAQVSRKISDRIVKAPMLSDIKDSGAIEQYSDIVGLLHNDFYHNDLTLEDKSGENSILQNRLTKLIIAKNRNGRIGVVNYEFIPKLAMFKDCEDTFLTTDE